MTIAISIKIDNGVVLASDSASSMCLKKPDGSTGISNVYENGNKIFNLKKGFALGAITWGCGSIGHSTIETIVKDFRNATNIPEKYTVQTVAQKFKEFVYEQHYNKFYTDLGSRTELGFVVAGFSTGSSNAEEWEIKMDKDGCKDPKLVRPVDQSGLSWYGQPEALTRIIKGFSQILPQVMHLNGIADSIIMKVLSGMNNFQASFVEPTMPTQDAIDLAEFLVDIAIKYSKFCQGPPTVGGPIEISTLTKHEKFKWIRRKHFFPVELNQREGTYQ